MRPQRSRSMGWSAAWQPRKTALRLASSTRAHWPPVMWASRASSWQPALLTSTLSGPASASIRATASCQSSALVTSNGQRKARPAWQEASASASSRFSRTPRKTRQSGSRSRKWRATTHPRTPFAPVMRMRRWSDMRWGHAAAAGCCSQTSGSGSVSSTMALSLRNCMAFCSSRSSCRLLMRPLF